MEASDFNVYVVAMWLAATNDQKAISWLGACEAASRDLSLAVERLPAGSSMIGSSLVRTWLSRYRNAVIAPLPEEYR